MNARTNQSLYQITAIFIALSLFTVGRFGFFDLLGLKRIVEILLFIPLGFLGILLLLTHPSKWSSPFFLLPCSYLLVQVSWNWDMLQIADLSAAILVIAIILTLGKNFSALLLSCLIRIATFFAFLGLIEFILLLINPELAKKILLFYDNYSGSTVPVIENCLQLLGLADGTSYHLWGMSVTRLRSFTSEPSLLVGYFLVPGALALTFRGKFLIYGLICILFCISSLSGSVFLALVFTMIVYLLSFLKSRKLLIILPFFILIAFIWVLNNFYSELIGLSKTTAGSYDFLDKTNSANVRFSYIRDYASIIFASPFGLNQEIRQPLGLLIGSLARGGIIGFTFILVILFNLYSSLTSLLIQSNTQRLQKMGVSIIYGALTAGILYLDNCFIQLYGFVLLLLTHNRLQQLIKK